MVCRTYDVHLEGAQGGVQNFRAVEIPVICTPMSRQGVPNDLISAFGPLRFADSYEANRTVSIDLLIGLDYWKFMKAGIIKLPWLVAQETVLGWIVSGSLSDCTDMNTVTMPCNTISLCCLSDIPEDSLKNFWDLESVGILPVTGKLSDSVDPELDKFEQTVQYSEAEKRYEVCLP
jgi:hypothetical protein